MIIEIDDALKAQIMEAFVRGRRVYYADMFVEVPVEVVEKLAQLLSDAGYRED